MNTVTVYSPWSETPHEAPFLITILMLCMIAYKFTVCAKQTRRDTANQDTLAAPERRLTAHQVYEQVKSRLTKNSVVGRQQTKSCHELWQLERSNRQSVAKMGNSTLPLFGGTFRCYACNATVREVHCIYVLCCKQCGEQFRTLRTLRRNLGGKVALVVGGRTKLGHQVAMKLLEAGALVCITTRFPEIAREYFQKYPHYASFAGRLSIAPLDLKDVAHGGFACEDAIERLLDHLDDLGSDRLDILVNCAAQTIAVREQQSADERRSAPSKNRYGDALYVDSQQPNSWALGYEQVSDDELRDVINVNAIAIDIVTKRLLPRLKRARSPPFIVNVHAREGLQSSSKSASHYHTNMAKAALHMLTRMLIEQNLMTDPSPPPAAAEKKSAKSKNGSAGSDFAGGERHLFRIHGVCPGWFSVDEYYENGAPLPFAPLDEIDAASRICYPIFADLPSERRTRRHFTRFAT